MEEPRIVILGGGFGGVRCALDIEKGLRGKARITLIDKNNYHFFTPALYEVASAYQMGEDPYRMRLRKAIAISYGDIFGDRQVDIIQAEIASVDIERKHVSIDGGQELDFDYLLFALGSQTADFGIPGVNEYAYQFKTTDDAIALNQKLDSLFSEVSTGMGQMPMKLLVIGAGFAGIELAAELVTCARKLCIRYKLDKRAFSVILFEAAPTILPMVNESERKKIMDRLTELGVVIMANSTIESVQSDLVKLKNGQTMNGSAVIWTAGVQANKLAATIHGLPVTARGKVTVDQYLRATGMPNIFALGDVAEFIDPKTQKPIPGLAHLAQAQGSLIARNLAATIHGGKLKEYKPDYSSWVAPVGGKFAVAHVGNIFTASGILGWLVRNLVDLRYFLSILSVSKALKLFTKDVMIFSRND